MGTAMRMLRSFGTTAIGVGLTITAWPILASAAPPPDVQMVEKAKPAVVLIRAVWSGRILIGDQLQPLKVETWSSGSGFGVHEEGWFVTNAHVVLPPWDVRSALCRAYQEREVTKLSKQGSPSESRREQQFLDDMRKQIRLGQDACSLIGATIVDDERRPLGVDNIPRQVAVVTYGGVPGAKEIVRGHPAEVRFFSPPMQKDIAILKTERKNVPSLSLGDSSKLTVPEKVFVLGYPGDVTSLHETGELSADTSLEVSVKEGTISALRKSGADQSPIFEFSAAITYGNSGGPVINARGEVVGVATFSTRSNVQGFNFMRPVNVVKEFLRAHVEPKQGEIDRLYAEALTRFWLAQDAEAAKDLRTAFTEFKLARGQFATVLDLYREHPGAEAFVEQAATAQQRIEPRLGFDWMRWLPYGGGGLGVIIVVALVGLFMSRRAGAPRSAPPAGTPTGGGRAHLIVQSGAQAGSRLPIPHGGMRIGRDSQLCQIVVPDASASKEHALIKPSGNGGVTVMNLSKTNPTYLNDRAVTEAPLKDNDLIKVGDTVFIFKAGS